jgi:ABC-2 type transport system ATP-binding protein
MIQVDSLTRCFGDTFALKNISFSVAPGEIVGFLGPNGAGKTTAMRILTCTLAPTSGMALVAGHDVSSEPLAVRQRLGFMPEHVPLYPENRVHEFLHFVAHLKGVPHSQVTAQLQSIEAQTGLTEVRHQLVGQLSKGYRQRVGLAQALVGDPDILILDEPAVGLDPHQNVEIRDLIRSFRGKKTVLLSSHILSEVSLTCERVLILNRGRLVAEENPAVLASQVDARPQVILRWSERRSEVLDALTMLEGVAEVLPTPEGADVVLRGEPERWRPQLAAAVHQAGGLLQGMQDRVVSLEDLFLRLTYNYPAGGESGRHAEPTAPTAGGDDT